MCESPLLHTPQLLMIPDLINQLKCTSLAYKQLLKVSTLGGIKRKTFFKQTETRQKYLSRGTGSGKDSGLERELNRLVLPQSKLNPEDLRELTVSQKLGYHRWASIWEQLWGCRRDRVQGSNGKCSELCAKAVSMKKYMKAVRTINNWSLHLLCFTFT